MKACMLCDKPEHVGMCSSADYKAAQAKREGPTLQPDAQWPRTAEQKTGGSVDYYKCHVADPISKGEPYTAESIDIIEALGMTFAEGEAFKAIWRTCTGRMGGAVKADNKALYNAEKVEFFGARRCGPRKGVKRNERTAPARSNGTSLRGRCA